MKRPGLGNCPLPCKPRRLHVPHVRVAPALVREVGSSHFDQLNVVMGRSYASQSLQKGDKVLTRVLRADVDQVAWPRRQAVARPHLGGRHPQLRAQVVDAQGHRSQTPLTQEIDKRPRRAALKEAW